MWFQKAGAWNRLSLISSCLHKLLGLKFQTVNFYKLRLSYHNTHRIALLFSAWILVMRGGKYEKENNDGSSVKMCKLTWILGVKFLSEEGLTWTFKQWPESRVRWGRGYSLWHCFAPAEKTVKVDLVKYLHGLCCTLGLTSLFNVVFTTSDGCKFHKIDRFRSI